MTPAELEALAGVMIRLRVLKCGLVELHPSAFGDGSAAFPKDLGAPPTCKCGHEDAEHGATGLCYRGCEPMTCADESGKTPADHG